ncbi:MAG: hypothetical protein B6I28_00610 [Fusobacteriia bacterium 4572_132]|nr:MAG: hypothetical protein B6I28_00610 [Fusobacteriia bacterium 4572_132]
MEGDNMSYTALYRKWRPNIFEEIIGQKHIVDTLKNQIKNNSIAHAYLFNGTRGTGKTTIARVFSRAINCENRKEYNPCNECDICLGSINETLMDIIEIDAASNNGVDNIRELRENIKYPPSKAKYKVYIIDEVHMLSQGAFNALLKILEEPPSYVVFILATTELHKIPDTIHSRCQTYSFKRVTQKDIKDRMKFILESMNIEYEDKALDVVIKKGEGAVRDSLSLLDMCISASENGILYEEVMNVLGLSNEELYYDIVNAIIKNDPLNLMKKVELVFNEGKNIVYFLKDLIMYLRNILLLKTSEELKSILDLPNEEIERLLELSKNISSNNLLRIIEILIDRDNSMKYSNNARVSLEITLLKALNSNFELSLSSLVDRVEKLEKKHKNLESQNISFNKEIKTNNLKSNEPDCAKESKIENLEILETENKSIKISKREEVENEALDDNNDIDKFKIILDNWDATLNYIKKYKIAIHAFLIEGMPKYIENNNLIIGFDEKFGFHLNAIEKKENKDIIEKVIYKQHGIKINILPKFNNDINGVEINKINEKEIKDEVKEFFKNYEDKLEIIE